MTTKDLVAEAKAHVAEIDLEDARGRLEKNVTVLATREPAESVEERLPGAVHVPRGVLEFKVGDHPVLLDPARPVLVYCKTGGRDALAARTLERMGFSGVGIREGGYDAWREAGMPTEKDPAAC